MPNIIGYSEAQAAGLSNPEAYLFVSMPGHQSDEHGIDDLPDDFTVRELLQHTFLCIGGLIVISGLIYMAFGLT